MAARRLARSAGCFRRFLAPTSHFRSHAVQWSMASRPSVCQNHLPSVASLHTSNPLHNDHMFNVQDEDDFKERVLKNSVPVIVDFHASWCGPCKLLGPRLEAVVTENDGKVLLAKVDIDDNQDLAIYHGVQAVPTVLGIKDGQVVDKFVGLVDETALDTFVQKLVGPS